MIAPESAITKFILSYQSTPTLEPDEAVPTDQFNKCRRIIRSGLAFVTLTIAGTIYQVATNDPWALILAFLLMCLFSFFTGAYAVGNTLLKPRKIWWPFEMIAWLIWAPFLWTASFVVWGRLMNQFN